MDSPTILLDILTGFAIMDATLKEETKSDYEYRTNQETGRNQKSFPDVPRYI